MNDQDLGLIKTYRHVTDNQLERIRFSQTKVGDRIRIVDTAAPGPGKDGMTVFSVTAPPQFSLRALRWKLNCDDGKVAKVSKSLFEAADRNVSKFVGGPTG